MYSLCFYRVQDHETARELVQDIFFSIWERRDALQINGAPEHYLLRAAKLKVMEHFRNAQVRQRYLEEIAVNTRAQENTTENYILLNELRGRLKTYVETLPAQCRRVFELSRQQGLNIHEISVEMVISEKTVKNHLTRALASMRCVLE